MGHTRLQAPQSTHFSSFLHGKIWESLFNKDSIAPNGHMVLQNILRWPITNMIMTNRIMSLTANEVIFVVPFIMAQGTADSMVATGQSLQK
jgi:hypothetical protein